MMTDSPIMNESRVDSDEVEKQVPPERLEEFRELRNLAVRNDELRERLRSPQTISDILRQIIREVLHLQRSHDSRGQSNQSHELK